MITTILFDLDGTLLPMDQDRYAKAYINGLAKAAESHGYEPMTVARTIWAGTAAMIQNDGSQTNEEAFWKVFTQTYGEQALMDVGMFDDFYANEFQQIQKVCGYNLLVPELIRVLKEKGLRIVLATNPIFPKVATDSRIRWAGLSPQDFEFYTTFENSRHSKPNLDYYRDILDALNVPAEECIMVGNDVAEDMITEQLGMKVFLLTDCLINKHEADISQYPNGNIEKLSAYLLNIIK